MERYYLRKRNVFIVHEYKDVLQRWPVGGPRIFRSYKEINAALPGIFPTNQALTDYIRRHCSKIKRRRKRKTPSKMNPKRLLYHVQKVWMHLPTRIMFPLPRSLARESGESKGLSSSDDPAGADRTTPPSCDHLDKSPNQVSSEPTVESLPARISPSSGEHPPCTPKAVGWPQPHAPSAHPPCNMSGKMKDVASAQPLPIQPSPLLHQFEKHNTDIVDRPTSSRLEVPGTV